MHYTTVTNTLQYFHVLHYAHFLITLRINISRIYRFYRFNVFTIGNRCAIITLVIWTLHRQYKVLPDKLISNVGV